LKSKSGESVFEGIKKLFHKNGKPANLNVDIGNEFIYSLFKKYCEDNNIEVWFSNPEQDNKNAIIERFHRTLRNMILKYSVAISRPYIDVLQSLIKNYNCAYHKTIKNTLLDIWNRKKSNNQSINIISHSFN
jgi:transposase InsO family protein